MDQRPLKSAWLLPPVMVLLVFAHTTVTLVLAGVLASVAGTAVASDFRGIAARIPPQLGWTAFARDGSPASTRKTFAAVAIAGPILILFALAK